MAKYRKGYRGTPASSQIWAERRRYMDDGGWLDCPYCESPLHYTDGHVDHIHPHSLGGNNKINNLVLVCTECNKSKGNIKLSIWLYLQHITPEGVYARLKALGKRIPDDLLDLLNYSE